MSRALLASLCGALLLVLLAGCGGSRVVTIERPAPPPSVVTRTDTVLLASPPDTLFLPAETVRVVETVPVEVVRYVDPRPDTSRAFLLWQFAVDSARVEISGAAADASYRRPQPGETLRCVADGPSSLSCRVEGEPVAPPAQRIECPACPEPLIPRSLVGYLTLLSAVFFGAAIGLLAHAVLAIARS